MRGVCRGRIAGGHTVFFLGLALVVAMTPLLFGQAQETSRASSCGPADVKFHVRKTSATPSDTADTTRAHVYVIEVFRKPSFEFFLDPTLKVGIDGKWVGATRSKSYLVTAVEAGEHHVCVAWQSIEKRLPALASFNAEAGKSYYFRARIMYPGGLDLQRLDPDEGQLLVSHSSLSLSTEKK